ncbi:MAG: FkbM family methyltransferase, partial [Chlamydiales bacterium]|nr:FkbM family methyltransferase [Chlamydiales bacterium]
DFKLKDYTYKTGKSFQDNFTLKALKLFQEAPQIIAVPLSPTEKNIKALEKLRNRTLVVVHKHSCKHFYLDYIKHKTNDKIKIVTLPILKKKNFNIKEMKGLNLPIDPSVPEASAFFSRLVYQYQVPVKGIVHLGAYFATEASYYNRMGATSTLFVEANPELMPQIEKNIAPYPGMQAINCAVADKDGSINLQVTNNKQSSSILDLKEHLEQYPTVQKIKEVTVPLKKLDTIFADKKLDFEAYNLLNMDIQGAELLALKGARELLKHIDAIYTEVNTKELYKGCARLNEIDDFLSSCGFVRVEESINYSRGWGDAFYVKQSHLEQHSKIPLPYNYD